MKRTLVTCIATILTASLLMACTPSQRSNVGMLGGAVAGGVAGSAISGGSTAGTVAGAAGGAYLGRELAN